MDLSKNYRLAKPGSRSNMDDSTGRVISAREIALASLVYIVATVALTYPLAFHPASLGRLDNADAQLNAWAMSWVAHQVVNDPFHLFQANIFYPLPNTLAFSEHLFIPGLIALPILRLSDDLVLTFNMVLLVSIFVSALGMYVLVRVLTGNHTAALLSGLFFSFATYRFVRLPHIQMQLYGFLPLALACIHRFFSSGKSRWAAVFAVVFVIQALSGTYLAAIAAVAVAVAWVALALAHGLDRRQTVSWVLALGLIVLALIPFVRPYLWVNRTLGVEWDLEGVGSLAATPGSYLASPSRLYEALAGENTPAGENTDYLFPGFTLLVLGAAGIWVLLSRRGDRGGPRVVALCYLVILVLGVVISLGPQTPVYPFLYRHIVFFRGLRALSRFGLLLLLSSSVLSGYALAWLLGKLSRQAHRNAFALTMAAVFIGESSVIPLSLTGYEDRPPEAYTWLREKGKPGPIVELPYKRIDTRYMFSSRHHGFRPMLNGDSGFVPQPHVWMREIFLRFPSPDSILLLGELDVRYVVLHLGAYRLRTRRLDRLMEDLKTYEKEFPTVATFDRDLILQVEARGARPSANTREPTGSLTPREAKGPLFDSNLDTVWKGGPSPSNLVIRFDGIRGVSGVRFRYGRTPRCPVTGVRVDARDGKGEWKTRWRTPDDWPALAELVLALLDNPQDGSQTLAFPPISTDSLRLELGGYDGKSPEIAELEILTSGSEP
jgi:hypothetical protein